MCWKQKRKKRRRRRRRRKESPWSGIEGKTEEVCRDNWILFTYRQPWCKTFFKVRQIYLHNIPVSKRRANNYLNIKDTWLVFMVCKPLIMGSDCRNCLSPHKAKNGESHVHKLPSYKTVKIELSYYSHSPFPNWWAQIHQERVFNLIIFETRM